MPPKSLLAMPGGALSGVCEIPMLFIGIHREAAGCFMLQFPRG